VDPARVGTFQRVKIDVGFFLEESGRIDGRDVPICKTDSISFIIIREKEKITIESTKYMSHLSCIVEFSFVDS